jgi:uncharacterized protein YndB with AHSA1/START domain
MNQPKAIELSIRIAASPETVFRFFSDPQRYKLWMGDQSTMNPGSSGVLTVSFGPGPTAVGKMVEWEESKKIVFLWSHQGDEAAVPSRVTITLKEIEEGTLVTLRHEGIIEQVEREGTASGWRHYLSALTNAVLAEHLSIAGQKTIETYLSAWSQIDPAQRSASLALSVSDDVRFRDRYGSINGREALVHYVGGVQKMMGPAYVQPDGPLDRVHNFFRQNWLIPGPDDSAQFRGQNIYEFDAQARLILILGFWS